MARRRRADLLRAFLRTQPGHRARVKALADHVTGEEKRDDPLSGAAISVTVRQENDRLEARGEPPVFRCYPESEEWGWVSLRERPMTEEDSGVSDRIRQHNDKVEEELRRRLAEMDWRMFESTFLTQVLEALGFQDVEITRATRDGGVDARVTYQRGLVKASAIVSAKHWKNRVPVDEVRNVRGIKGPEDTAIIITTGKFSADAEREAEPGQNQRAVYLIEGQKIVEICRTHGIGVRKIQLPDLFALDEQAFAPEEDEEVAAGSDESAELNGGLKRLRDEMLGDRERGLSAEEIAKITGLEVSTLRSYLSVPERRRALFERLRTEHRDRALKVVSQKRS